MNIQVLATETLKVKNNIAPEIMKEFITPEANPYDLQKNCFRKEE